MSEMTPDDLMSALEKLAAERGFLDTEPHILAAYDTLAAESGVSRQELLQRAFILVRREVVAWRRATGGGMRVVPGKGER